MAYRLMTYPINSISYLTDIHIEKNKRNYQKQEWHLEDMRSKKNEYEAKRTIF